MCAPSSAVDRALADARLLSIEEATVHEFVEDVRNIVSCIYGMAKDKDTASAYST